MKHKYFLKIAMLFVFAMFTHFSFGQTTIVSNGFEGGDSWTTSSGTPTSNSDAGAGDTPSNSRIKSGTKSWLINSGTETVEFTSQNVTGKVDVKILVYISSTAGTSGNGADASDYIKVWANVDGVGFPATADIQLNGNSNARWDYNASLSSSTAAGTNIVVNAPQSGTNANNYSVLEITIPDGSTSVALKVEGKNNSGNEMWNIDDITLVGETPSSDPTVSFDTASSSVNETDIDVVTTGIPVTFTNFDSNVTITPTVDGSSTAEPGDYTIDLTPIVFDANETNAIPLTIHDDADMDGETIIINFTVTSGTADLGTSQHTVTITDDDIPDIVISEIMYNTNTPGSDDEWIELYNDDDGVIDINGWTLEYASSSYTFSSATEIPSKGYITIAVGSSNSGGDYQYNADFPFQPDFNTLGHTYSELVTTTAGGDTNKLTNSSATITLKNAANTVIDTVTYDDGDTDGDHDGDGNSLEIIDVDADNSVTSANWRTSSNVGGSPGASITSVWSGAISNVWNLAGNWDNGVPTSTINARIPVTANQPTASAAATAKNVIINSGASLIAQDDFTTGNVTYQRSLGTANWYLVSSPLNGETVEDLIGLHDLAAGTGANVGIAPYDNTQADANDRWDYQTSASTGALGNGKGYSVKFANSGMLSFSGSINTADVNSAVTVNSNGLNLVGNPFTAFVNSGTGGFLPDNTGLLTSQTLWVWNQATSSYDAKVTADEFNVAPGQGFFIEANGGGNVSFTEADQEHSGADSFQRTVRPEIHISLNDGSLTRQAKVYYIDGTTTAFDNGYDGELFSGVANTFAVYSHLVSDSQGKNYQIQSLPNADFESMIVPIGVNATSGKEITFSVETMNLPSDIKVFLEDKETGTFTNLNDGNYSITLTKDLNGIGQFYLHTSRSSLKVNELDLENVSIYKSNATTLTIAGLESGNTSLVMFDVLGKKVHTTSFKATTINNVNLPTLKTGIYVVQLVSEKGKVSKKIIIE